MADLSSHADMLAGLSGKMSIGSGRCRAGVSAEGRTVLDLSLQGYLVRDVAVEIGVSELTVIRIRKELQRKLEKLMPADA